MNYIPLTLLEYNNSTAPPQKCGIVSWWFIADEKSCTNDSITFLNVYSSTLYTEGNKCGIIAIPAIEITIDK